MPPLPFKNRCRLQVEQLEARALLSAASDQFLTAAYPELLDRAVDPTGLAGWGRLADQGVANVQIVNGITASREFRTKEVEQLYQSLLGRRATAGELNDQLRSLDRGGRLEQLEAKLLGSREYYDRNGGTKVGFLRGLFRDVLSRALDPQSEAYYLRLLKRHSREQIARSVVGSREARTLEVQSAYQQVLDRGADQAGLANHVNLLGNGLRREQLLAALVASNEFVNKPPPGPPDANAPVVTILSPGQDALVRNNVTITGRVTDVGTGVARLEARQDDRAPVNVAFDAAGNFSFTTLVPINGSADGLHRVRFTATDRAGNASAPAELRFTLDTTSPTQPTFDLDPAFDTGAIGDGRTDLTTVTLAGRADPNQQVTLVETGATATADVTGRFTFANVGLQVGANTFTARSVDPAGNASTFSRTIFRNSPPTVAAPLADVTVARNAPDTTISLAGVFANADNAVTSIVRFSTSRGAVDVELFDDRTPRTVANFLNYVTSGRYNDSFFHRDVPGFVLQGGGFRFQDASPRVVAVPTDPPVVNEPGISNTRGTIAMAKLGGDPNSATSQFFFNLADNGGPPSSLDTQNGGFTVFGQVLGGGLQVIDALAGFQRFNLSSFNGAFTDLPLTGYTNTGNFPNDATRDNFALVSSVNVVRFRDVLTFSALTDNPGLVTAAVNGSNLVLSYVPNQTGTALITVRATDSAGSTVQTTFRVTVT